MEPQINADTRGEEPSNSTKSAKKTKPLTVENAEDAEYTARANLMICGNLGAK